MRNFLFQFIFLFCFGPSCWAIDNYVFSNFCRLFDKDGSLIHDFHGSYCAFYNDGEYIRYDGVYLQRFDRKNQARWKIKFHVHHQMKPSADGKDLLVVTAKVKNILGCPTRMEGLAVIDRKTGRVKRRFDLEDHMNELLPHMQFETILDRDFWEERNFGTKCEGTHINSIYEIPANPRGFYHPAFRKGNYIVSSVRHGITMILDRSMKKILWIQDLSLSWPHIMAHDVQVLPNGNILLYRNNQLDENGKVYVAADEIDPETGNPVMILSVRKIKIPFCILGGVQKLDEDHFLVSYDDPERKWGASIIDRESNESFWLSPLHGNPVQDIKALDLTSFLKNSQGW